MREEQVCRYEGGDARRLRPHEGPRSPRWLTGRRRALAARWALTSLCLAVLCASVADPACALTAHTFDFAFAEAGSGPGQLEDPGGVALGEESASVYVVDRGNARIQQFSQSGTPLAQFDGAAAPTGPLEAPKDIAVDNSKNPLDPSEGDLYVSGEVKVAGEPVHVIYKFSEGGTYIGQISTGSGGGAFGELFGVAVDSAGQLWVFQESGQVDRYSNSLENELASSCESPRGPSPGLAVDSEDHLYVNTGNRRFAKLNDLCEELIFEVDTKPRESSAAAVDSETGEVYIDDITSAARFSPSAELRERFAGEEEAPEGDLREGAGIAVDSGAADKLTYVADEATDSVKVYRQVTLPSVASLPATDLGPEKATLNATVNPEGVQVSSCVFEYGESTAYGQSVPCQPSPGSGEAPVAVSAKPAGLEAGKTYHYRISASNENGQSEGEDESFTLGPGILAQSVSEVSADAASFQATIDPHRAPTEAFFQYGTSTAYGSSAPASPVSIGQGEGAVEVAPQHVQGLAEATTYHYRVVAIQEGRQFPGPDRSFSTQGQGGQLRLPDGRAWELVSPAEKRGGVIEGISIGAVQAAESGAGMSYLANAPTEAAPEGSAGLIQVLSSHSAAGWSSKDIAGAHLRATGKGSQSPPEYQMFDQGLSAGLIQPWGLFEARLSEAASEQTPYLRALSGCAADCYRPLVSAKAGQENALAGFGEEGPCEEENGKVPFAEVLCGPRFVGASADLRHIALISPAPLAEGAGREQLYEWSGGALAQVSLLPRNEAGEELPAPEGRARLGAGLGFEGHIEGTGSVKRAVSAEGARVFWEVEEAGGEGTLYVRDTQLGQTLELGSAEAGCGSCESGGGRFQIASADGSSVLFTDKRKLMKDAGGEGADLYECRIVIEGGKLACELSDLTPQSGGESARVQGSVLGAGEDDQIVYFVAEGTLGAGANARGQAPLAGQPNLFAHEGGQSTFIATLAAGDRQNWTGHDENQPVRVSANGQWLSFMSESSLTGYDNRDAASGAPDAEVYEYEASTGALSCASCDPSGARPHGVQFKEIVRSDRELLVGGKVAEWREEGWVAALTPGIPSYRLLESAYQTRSLSDSGRLFFNDLDPLLPQDVNGNWDVYEREPEGVGGCAAGAVGYEASARSCLGMISSGASAQQSAFMDASTDGSDVFFITSAKLTGKDIDQSRDIYDAHECGAGWACAPEEAVQSPPCSTEASCRPAPSPQPQIFGSPASASFSGPGNPPPPPPGKPKRPTRHQLLLKALASCHKRFAHSKAKRGSCERQARRRYGTVAKRKPAKKGAKGAKGRHR